MINYDFLITAYYKRRNSMLKYGQLHMTNTTNSKTKSGHINKKLNFIFENSISNEAELLIFEQMKLGSLARLLLPSSSLLQGKMNDTSAVHVVVGQRVGVFDENAL